MGNSIRPHEKYDKDKLNLKQLADNLHSCRFASESFGKIKCCVEKSQLTISEERYFNYEITDKPIKEKDLCKSQSIIPHPTEEYSIKFENGLIEYNSNNNHYITGYAYFKQGHTFYKKIPSSKKFTLKFPLFSIIITNNIMVLNEFRNSCDKSFFAKKLTYENKPNIKINITDSVIQKQIIQILKESSVTSIDLILTPVMYIYDKKYYITYSLEELILPNGITFQSDII